MTVPRMRFLVLSLFALSALTLTSCSSNNDGKIVGRWKIVESSNMTEEVETLNKAKIYKYFEFTADGKVTTGAASDDFQLFNKLAEGLKPVVGKYSLGSGNTVTLSDFTKPDGTVAVEGVNKAKPEIIIVGDSMTIRDRDGSVQKLVRIPNTKPTLPEPKPLLTPPTLTKKVDDTLPQTP